jgi:hypothetical protein
MKGSRGARCLCLCIGQLRIKGRRLGGREGGREGGRNLDFELFRYGDCGFIAETGDVDDGHDLVRHDLREKGREGGREGDCLKCGIKEGKEEGSGGGK